MESGKVGEKGSLCCSCHFLIFHLSEHNCILVYTWFHNYPYMYHELQRCSHFHGKCWSWRTPPNQTYYCRHLPLLLMGAKGGCPIKEYCEKQWVTWQLHKYGCAHIGEYGCAHNGEYGCAHSTHQMMVYHIWVDDRFKPFHEVYYCSVATWKIWYGETHLRRLPWRDLEFRILEEEWLVISHRCRWWWWFLHDDGKLHSKLHELHKKY